MLQPVQPPIVAQPARSARRALAGELPLVDKKGTNRGRAGALQEAGHAEGCHEGAGEEDREQRAVKKMPEKMAPAKEAHAYVGCCCARWSRHCTRASSAAHQQQD